MSSVTGRLVDILQRRIYPARIAFSQGHITSIEPVEDSADFPYIIPGFIDAHIHIESSMLIPSEFARLATVHGTVATVSDPHEIANVLGLEGIRYMIENGNKVPFHFAFGASSCVPATKFETAGASISDDEIRLLFQKDHLKYLSEMMNFPGVIQRDPHVMQKIETAREFHKPVDGHAPGLRGEALEKYIQAGIITDHECVSLEEAEEKIRKGMHILIREGSAARNYEALHPLIKTSPSKVMFCSDDKHPHQLVEGHINRLVKRSVLDHSYDLMDVLRIACYHPIQHYQLDVGLLQPGDSADFLTVKNLKDFQPTATYIQGIKVAENGRPLIPSVKASVINKFHCHTKKPQDFSVPTQKGELRVIEAFEGQLITKEKIMAPSISRGHFVTDTTRDLLKITVVNRYSDAPAAVGFIHGFGLKTGALASSVAHDSHNIVCVGVNDEEICEAVNALISQKGGICAVGNRQVHSLSLPVGGIMSAADGYEVAQAYIEIDQQAKALGTHLEAPFMTLSFMALLVIPSLKLSDKGLFDGERFQFTSLTV